MHAACHGQGFRNQLLQEIGLVFDGQSGGIRPAGRRNISPARALAASPSAGIGSACAQRKICAAAAIHPDAAAVVTPRAAFNAARIASLPNHAHPATRICRAVVPAHIVRRTSHRRLPISAAVWRIAIPSPTIGIVAIASRRWIAVAAAIWTIAVAAAVVSIPSHFKIGPAAAVHPDAASVITPRSALDTRRIAALTNHAHAAACVHRTVMAAHIVGRTSDGALRKKRGSGTQNHTE